VGFLRRLFGGTPTQSWPPPGPITSWPVEPLRGEIDANGYLFPPVGRSKVEVVGEGSYQGTLEQMAGGRTVDGPRVRDHMALLLPEPTNPYDTNAVRVLLVPATTGATAKVGYLSREDAVRYRAVIDRLAAAGRVMACRASIKGGWDRGSGDRGSFGVTLHLGTMADCESELVREPLED